MRILLLSNSTNAGQAYLAWATQEIGSFLGILPTSAVFIPYAGVSIAPAAYEAKVAPVFASLGCKLTSIEHEWNPLGAIENASLIVVGGGNTWQLVRRLHQLKLMDAIRDKVKSGTPYIGWSAGSNIACPTMQTTNDMPIADPLGMDTLNLIPFQINPHYLDANPQGHAGETREDRIREYILLHPDTFVLGLRESTLLRLEENHLQLKGDRQARLFRKDWPVRELSPGDDLSFLLEETSPAVYF
jgi:dipeptidase E